MPQLRRPPGPQRVLQILRALAWSCRAVGEVRAVLRRGGVSAPVPGPPAVPRQAVRGVRWGLVVRRATCLERSLVLQRWLAEHGDRRAVLIGVAKADGRTLAHAWLEGQERLNDREYVEMTRIAPS